MRDLALAAVLVLAPAAAPAASPAAVSAGMPGFEANQGQTDPAVRFLARGASQTLFLTDGEAVLTLAARPGCDRQGRQPGDQPPAPLTGVVRARFVGGRPTAVHGVERLAATSNYLRGTRPAAWRSAVPRYARVRYEQLYPGVDLVFYGNDGRLEFDFVLAPGADPARIRLAFSGAGDLALDDAGNLLLPTPAGTVRVDRPVAYQDGGRRTVPVAYRRLGRQVIGLTLGDYDPAQPLVVDPVINYSTYLGGQAEDLANVVVAGPDGSTYLAGWTFSADFPTASARQAGNAGNYDAFVSRIDASGSGLVFSTYLGGSDSEYAYGLALDPLGNIYLSGHTTSTDFPLASAAQGPMGAGDAFLSKLDPAGAGLLYSTHLGGSRFDAAHGLAVDASGNAYVAGETASSDFPVLGPGQATSGGAIDAFVTRFAPDGTPLQSTYLGGRGFDVAWAVAGDSLGNAVVAGSTDSDDFPTVNALWPTFGGIIDGFAAKLPAGGGLPLYSTYLGGESDDYAFAVATDGNGDAYVVGQTASTTFPVANAVQPALAGGIDAFLTRLTSDGSVPRLSTYLGGGTTTMTSPDDLGLAVALDPSGNVILAGTSASDDFPLRDPVQAVRAGGTDAFLSRLDPTGALLNSTLLGGSENDIAYGVAAGAVGDVYLSGSTLSPDFPLVRPVQSVGYGPSNGSDAFAARLCWDSPALPVGNNLRAVKQGPDLLLDWRRAALLPDAYAIHRETVPAQLDPPASPPISWVDGDTSWVNLAAIAFPEPLMLYQVARRDCLNQSIFR